MSTVKLSGQFGDASITQQWLEEAQETGETDTYIGKRKHPRTAWSAQLEIHYSGRRGKTKTVYALARDVSASGIGFECRENIPAYTEVLVCRAGQIDGMRAMTMHTTRKLGGFIIGCEFRVEIATAAVERIAKAG